MISQRLVLSVVSRRSALPAAAATRSFSQHCVAAQKLRVVFEEYRQQNYSRETPMRFKKDMYKVVANANNNGAFPVENLNNLLVNIGRSDQLLSENELASLLQEAGAQSRFITKDDMMELVQY